MSGTMLEIGMDASLTSEQIEEAAAMLTTARLSASTVPSLDPCAPTNTSAAHMIADRHAEMLGWDVVGWKVGSTSALAMKILGSSEPFPGRIFEGSVFGSKILQSEAIHEPLVESEFAFVLGKALPPRNQRYSVAELQMATQAIAPAFEVVTSRLEGGLQAGVLNLIADSGANGGVVLGVPTPTAECPPLSEVSVVLKIGGERIATGRGSDILGDPWQSLEWLVNHLSARQIGLKAGQIVLSGTCTGAHPLPRGSTATAMFSGLGDVALYRTAGS